MPTKAKAIGSLAKSKIKSSAKGKNILKAAGKTKVQSKGTRHAGGSVSNGLIRVRAKQNLKVRRLRLEDLRKAKKNPEVVYVAVAKQWKTDRMRKGLFGSIFTYGGYAVDVIGVYATATAAERQLKKAFPSVWVKEGTASKSTKSGDWTKQVILDVEAHEVVGSEHSDPLSTIYRHMTRDVWIAQCSIKEEADGPAAEPESYLAASLNESSRVLGVFSKLLGSSGANAYVTGTAKNHVSIADEFAFMDESDMIENIDYKDGMASLTLECDACCAPGLETRIWLGRHSIDSK